MLRTFFRSPERIRDAGRMGKVEHPGVGRYRDGSVNGMSDRHVDQNSRSSFPERWSTERLQR